MAGLTNMGNFSVLAGCDIKPLPTAIAHALVNCKATDQDRLVTLNRLYSRLNALGQLQVRAEILECQRAKRGECIAVVV